MCQNPLEKTFVPQSWVKAAAEAGVNVKLDPKLYSSFLDPNDPVNANYELVTRGQVLESIGRFPFDRIEFNRLQVGQPLPPDKNGNVFIKISDTQVQRALPNSFRPDTSKQKRNVSDFLGNP